MHYRDIFATLYHNMGIHPRDTVLHDPQGRPHHLLDNRRPIEEL